MATLAKIRIGTRKSALALVQAEMVKAALTQAKPELSGYIEVVSMSTSGDRFVDRPLSEIGGKGLFTKEIEEALLDNSVDIAVHSMKDMATMLPDGLVIGAMLPREDARDMLVGQGIASLDDIGQGAVVGTSSLRRSAQLLIRRPDLKIVPFRGNVQTRLAKLENREVRATILACAGLNRLRLSVPGVALPIDEFLPAVAQGAVSIECRENDAAILELLALLNHSETDIAVRCERVFLKVLDGSCRTPIAGYANISGSKIILKGLVAKPDGSEYYADMAESNLVDAEAMGAALGERLLAKIGKGFF
ncbi:MAG: hydroxymethylbilane synthase [Alphaproteobacteria bacterium]